MFVFRRQFGDSIQLNRFKRFSIISLKETPCVNRKLLLFSTVTDYRVKIGMSHIIIANELGDAKLASIYKLMNL